MALNVIQLYEISSNKDVLLENLQKWGLIPTEGYACPACGASLKLLCDVSRADGWRWRCPAKVSLRKQKVRTCAQNVEFRTGTFFARSKLPIFKILAFVNLWVSGATLKLIDEQLETSHTTTVQWAAFCRECVIRSFVVNKMMVGGVGKVVEIGVEKFRKRKHLVEGQLMVGGYECGSGRVFMVAVEDRDANTLQPVIEDWVHPGTTIILDISKPHDYLHHTGFVHLQTHLAINIKEHETNVTDHSKPPTQPITLTTNKKPHVPGNLALHMFHKRCKDLQLNRTVEFYRLAGQLYNPITPLNEQLYMEQMPEDEYDMDGLE